MFWISPSPLSRSKGNKWKAPEHPLSFSLPGVLRCEWGACVHQWPMDTFSLAGTPPAPSLCSQWLQRVALAAWRVLPDSPWELPLLPKHPCTSRGLTSCSAPGKQPTWKQSQSTYWWRRYLLEEYVVVLTFSPKDSAPEETEFFLSFSGYHYRMFHLPYFLVCFSLQFPVGMFSSFTELAFTFLWKPLIPISSLSLDLKEMRQSLTFQAHEKWGKIWAD